MHKLQIQGLFDLFVVLSSVVDLCIMRPMDLISEMSARKTAQAFSVFRILQLFRLARIFQLLRLSHELSLLAFNLAMSLKAVFWVFLLLFTLIYIGALFCASELGSSGNAQLRSLFGNLWASIFSHFKLMTLEQWVDVCNLAMEESPLWAVYFLCFIILTNLTLVNLVTGLIITGVVEHAKEEDWTWLEQLVEEIPFIEALEGLVRRSRGNYDAALDFCDFEVLLTESEFQAIVSLYGISLQMDARQLFDILDSDGNGKLEIRELAQCLLQLRGSNQCLHPVLVRHEVNLKGRSFAAHVAELEKKLPKQYFSDVADWEQSLNKQLREWTSETAGCGARFERKTSGPFGGTGSANVWRPGQDAEVSGQSGSVPALPSLLNMLHAACSSIEAGDGWGWAGFSALPIFRTPEADCSGLASKDRLNSRGTSDASAAGPQQAATYLVGLQVGAPLLMDVVHCRRAAWKHNCACLAKARACRCRKIFVMNDCLSDGIYVFLCHVPNAVFFRVRQVLLLVCLSQSFSRMVAHISCLPGSGACRSLALLLKGSVECCFKPGRAASWARGWLSGTDR